MCRQLDGIVAGEQKKLAEAGLDRQTGVDIVYICHFADAVIQRHL